MYNHLMQIGANGACYFSRGNLSTGSNHTVVTGASLSLEWPSLWGALFGSRGSGAGQVCPRGTVLSLMLIEVWKSGVRRLGASGYRLCGFEWVSGTSNFVGTVRGLLLGTSSFARFQIRGVSSLFSLCTFPCPRPASGSARRFYADGLTLAPQMISRCKLFQLDFWIHKDHQCLNSLTSIVNLCKIQLSFTVGSPFLSCFRLVKLSLRIGSGLAVYLQVANCLRRFDWYLFVLFGLQWCGLLMILTLRLWDGTSDAVRLASLTLSRIYVCFALVNRSGNYSNCIPSPLRCARLRFEEQSSSV